MQTKPKSNTNIYIKNWDYKYIPVSNNNNFCGCCGSTFLKQSTKVRNNTKGITLIPGRVMKVTLDKNDIKKYVKTKNGYITLLLKGPSNG